MTEKKIDELLNSNYDGIQEYDNDLPRWWVYLFVITVLFAIVYTVKVHMMQTPTDAEHLAQQLDELKSKQSAYQVAHAPKKMSAEDLMAFVSETKRVEAGKGIFAAKCVACHGASGEGLVGPNLTDEYWIHGGSIEAIHTVIENGVPEKGMLAWRSLISQDDINNVLAYVWSIKNLKVPGKAPQGDKES